MNTRDTRRRAPLISRRRLLYGATVTGAIGVGAWQMWPTSGGGNVASVTTDAIGDQVQRLPRGQLPVFAGSGEIRDLYRYAVEHGDEL